MFSRASDNERERRARNAFPPSALVGCWMQTLTRIVVSSMATIVASGVAQRGCRRARIGRRPAGVEPAMGPLPYAQRRQAT